MGLPLQQDLVCWYLKRRPAGLVCYESLKLYGGALENLLCRSAQVHIHPVEYVLGEDHRILMHQNDVPDNNNLQFVLVRPVYLSTHKVV